MRCSVCFAEMKQGPTGLECLVCDTKLEPLPDHGDSTLSLINSNRPFIRDVAILIVTVVIGLFFWAIIAFAPEESTELENEISAQALSEASALVVGDENAIIAQAFQLVERSGTAFLLREKGCQRIFGDDVETIQWFNAAGDALTATRPAFPGNWRMEAVCPIERGGAAVAALLNGGVALSHVAESGDLIWTQIGAATDLDPDHVVLLKQDEDLLLVSHDRSVSEVQVVSYEATGAENWKQTLSASSPVELIRVAETRLGDFLIAWREPETGVRLVIISTTGLVLQDNIIRDRISPLKSIAQDDIGRTLMLTGEAEIEIELVSQSGASERRISLGPSAFPIGVTVYEGAFFIFGASESGLMIWGMDPQGTLSERMDIQIDATILSGAVRRMNEAEAVLSLQTGDAARMEMVVDLRRLANGLIYETSSSTFDLPAPAELAPEDEVQSDTDSIDVPGSSEAIAPALNEVLAGTASIEPSVTPIAEETSVADASPSIEEELPNAVAEAPEDSDPRQDEEQLSLEEPVLDSSNPNLAPEPSQARCTFTCISLSEPKAEYVLMQSVERGEGESLADVSLRLNETHVNLCAVSGGEPEPTFERECRPE